MCCSSPAHISCPADAGGRHSRAGQADFSPSMQQLQQLLQAAVGPAWGTLPSAWRPAAAPAGDGSRGRGSGGRRGHHRRSGHAAAPDDAGVELQHGHTAQPQGQEQQHYCSRPAALLPVHGLQLSSRTRSLAASVAGTQAAADLAACAAQPGQPTTQQPRRHSHPQQPADTSYAKQQKRRSHHQQQQQQQTADVAAALQDSTMPHKRSIHQEHATGHSLPAVQQQTQQQTGTWMTWTC
ncbi:hypothetical protein COO60DRAFT_671376 [Scenedesmus sp. NREL 46B-D3]|nr:hypothetical protein COO60DRAFT_671376 [Scenedesmus sp. NREL 46B-D3]